MTTFQYCVRDLFFALAETETLSDHVQKDMKKKRSIISKKEGEAFVTATAGLKPVLEQIYTEFNTLPQVDKIPNPISKERKRWDEATANKLIAALTRIQPSLDALALTDPNALIGTGFGSGRIHTRNLRQSVDNILVAEKSAVRRDPGLLRQMPFMGYRHLGRMEVSP